MLGRALGKPSNRWMTTNTAAGRSGGRLLTSFIRVSTPPDEAPIVTMSCRFNKILPRPSSTQDYLT
jgi:hypothetical protein